MGCPKGYRSAEESILSQRDGFAEDALTISPIQRIFRDTVVIRPRVLGVRSAARLIGLSSDSITVYGNVINNHSFIGGHMGQTYHKLYYHAIWRTYRSEPSITPDIEKVLFPFLKNKAKRFKCYIFEVNGTKDHVHVAMSIPPTVAVSDILGKLKGSSSYFLNKELQITDDFSWQDGFGVLSFAEKDLPRIVEYIWNQKLHHRGDTLNKQMERVEGEDPD